MKRYEGHWRTRTDNTGKVYTYWSSVYPTYPEVHKDDICNYYTNINGTTYDIRYLRMKPKRWKDMKGVHIWPGWWRPTDKPRIIIQARQRMRAEIIYNEETEERDMKKFMETTFLEILMENLL